MAAKPPAFIPILTDIIGNRDDDTDGDADDALSPLATEAMLVAAPPEAAAGCAPTADPAPDARLEGDAPALSGDEAQTLIVELQTRIAAGAYALTDEILRSALAEMEAKLYRKISGRLRQELPDLIDTLLREQLERDRDA
jgi:hypothetical protein